MTQDEKYLRACYPDRKQIFGRTLDDLTVERAKLLDRCGYNPASVTPDSLLSALRVCSLPIEEARAYRVSGKGQGIWERIVLLVIKFRPDEFDKAVTAFHEYLAAGREVPEFWTDQKQTRESSCPGVLMLERDLMRQRFTLAQVNAMPLAEAQWRRLGAMEETGAIEFFTDDDKSVIDEVLAIATARANEERDRLAAAAAKEKEAIHGNG